jgi:hypothetical protein
LALFRGTLQSDSLRQESKGFSFALENILRGKITATEQLAGLVAPRFYNGNLDGGSKDINFSDGNPIRQSAVGDARLRQSDIPTLEKVIKAIKEKNSLRASISSKSDSLRQESKGFSFALENILRGKITATEQLAGLVAPRFYNGNLEDGSKNINFSDGNPIRQSAVGDAKLDQSDLNFLKDLNGLLRDPGINQSVKSGLIEYLRDNDTNTLGRLQAVMAEDDGLKNRVNGLIEQIKQTDGQRQLQIEVYAGILNAASDSQLSQTIASYEGKEISDVQLKATLGATVNSSNELTRVLEAAQEILTVNEANSGNQNTSFVLKNLGILLKSQDKLVKESALAVVQLIYQVELDSLEIELYQTLNQSTINYNAISGNLKQAIVRPSAGDFDYTQRLAQIKESVSAVVSDSRRLTDPTAEIKDELQAVGDLAATVDFRTSLPTDNMSQIMQQLQSLPSDTAQRVETRNRLLAMTQEMAASNRPQEFDAQFRPGIEKLEQERLEKKFVAPELGSNKPAWNHIRNRFLATIYPLVESLRADPKTSMQIARFLNSNANQGINPRLQFELRLGQLKKQRELTPTEERYLKSVEILSTLNPYMVACASVSPGETSEFLRQHFNKVSENTLANLKDGDYVPLIQVGLGPDGVTALGELVRNNPNLARQTLVIDAGAQPGGPFAVPEGPAWDLNSANSRGNEGRTMPDFPNGNELKTVRAYGNPTRWFPGERRKGEETRAGSINTTVDFLPTPDDISKARYPTNEELQLILSMQTSVLTNNVALSTKLISIDKNRDPDSQGDKIVTLEVTQANEEKSLLRLRTDALFISSGLGEDGYGFDLEGSRAKKVIEDTQDQTLPKITKTLDAFKALSSRYNGPERIINGNTLVIWGGGNSADTLIENIGNLFKDANPEVQNFKKLYVITSQDLSARPRYAQISDLKPRNGRGNFIEIVNSKVADVDYASEEGEPMDRSLVFLDSNGNVITDNAGNRIVADYGIAATGFRPKAIGEILQKYSDQIGDSSVDLKQPVMLPTNEKVSVAETLTNDPSILVVGTASKADLDNSEKLAQLPKEAREALLRNGAENAVAIGFRAPDTQAAVNIWINSRDILVPVKEDSNSRQVYKLNGESPVESEGNTVEKTLPRKGFLERLLGASKQNGSLRENEQRAQPMIDLEVSSQQIRIPNNVNDERPLLTPLFIYNVGNFIELESSEGKRVFQDFKFKIEYDKRGEKLRLLLGENSQDLPKEVIDIVKKAAEDVSFQTYALTSLRRKRANIASLDLKLSFINGYLDPRSSYVAS